MGKQQPNVIIFFTDQQRADTTGVHGNPMGLTGFDRGGRLDQMINLITGNY